MIGFLRDNTVQTVFVTLQATVIVYGILVTATLLKAGGYPEVDRVFWFSKFVRHAGLLFFVVPAGWVWLTYYYDQSNCIYPNLFTVGSGVVVIALLWWLFSVSAAGVMGGTILREAVSIETRPVPSVEGSVDFPDPSLAAQWMAEGHFWI